MQRTILVVAFTVLLCLPLIVFTANGGDFTYLASEALGYRFFYSVRLHAGPDATAWLPQGQLLDTIQNVFSYFLQDRNPAKLRLTLNTFAIATVATIDLLAVAILIVAARTRSIFLSDLFLIGLSLIAPIYLARDMASAALWSDYYLLNIALGAGALFLFQYMWRMGEQGVSLGMVAFAGAFVGLLASNKVSMACLGVPIVAIAISASPVSWQSFILKGVLAVAVSVFVFGFVFLASGMFQLEWIAAVVKPWFNFVRNPGSDGSRLIDSIATPYGALIVLSLLAGLTAVCSGPFSSRRLWVLTTITLMSAAAGAFILARPAATTVGDTAVQVLVLGAMALTTIDRIVIRRVAGPLLAGVCLLLFAMHPFPNFGYWLFNSGPIADGHWKFFEKVLTVADGRPITYYIPDNHYQSGDPFIILLKGSSDFPTWNVAAGGKKLLNYYAPNLSFVSDVTGGDRTTESNSVAVWFDLPGLEPTSDHYKRLHDIVKCCSDSLVKEPVASAGVIGYIAIIH
jgi:hypothetical protein